ncbi:hypothetical protein BDZ94DRAFT_1271253 [Collybia nuda]|uniref:Uncharacterized protein n=1 Tax=Collybia nuda TaxID=64659 RepID=A0A9P5XWP4_9AGAR|nr:hypothetical protein BDZ94DRAFT_1271253 [Collybia nuda]
MAQPPFYILVARSSVANSNTNAPSNILGHPTIQYHYTDDSPLSLWPQSPNEHVLVLDFNPTVMKPPTIQSMSKDLIVSGLKVEEAPGAAAADENNPRNDRMYIIDATINEAYVPMPLFHSLLKYLSTDDITYGDRNSAQDVLVQFKRRCGTSLS